MKRYGQCCECGCDFDIKEARRIVDRHYGTGTYEHYSPDGDMCEDCVLNVAGDDYGGGRAVAELMGDQWDDD